MRRIAALLVLPLLTGTLFAESPRHEEAVVSIDYGVALYHLFQDQKLAAITDIGAAQQRGRLGSQAEDAELLLGSLYYDYGLVADSQRIFENMLDNGYSPQTRDRVWFNLARVQYEQGDIDLAQQLLSRIEGSLSPKRKAQQYYMLGNIFSKKKDFAAAAKVIREIEQNDIWSAYARLNLGLGQLLEQSDRSVLVAFLQTSVADPEWLALQDTARYQLGVTALRAGSPQQALDDLSAIHVSSPLSNKAMLASGWAYYQKPDLQSARQLWHILVEKKQNDAASQEARLALADLTEKAGDRLQAVARFRQVADDYDRSLQDLQQLAERVTRDSMIGLLDEQRNMDSEMDNEMDIENLKSQSAEKSDFSLPELYELFASEDFQQGLERYQELIEIRSTLEDWQQKIPTYRLMLNQRQRSFEDKKNALDEDKNRQQIETLLTRRDALAEQVERIEQQQDFHALANEDEVDYLEQIELVRNLIDRLQPSRDMSEASNKIRLISGLLNYQLETEYPARFWTLKRQLLLLDRSLDQVRESNQSLQLAAQQNALRLDDFEQRIAGQQQHIESQQERVQNMIDRQREDIDRMALQVIEQGQQHIRSLRLSARYSAARLLDELARADQPRPDESAQETPSQDALQQDTLQQDSPPQKPIQQPETRANEQ